MKKRGLFISTILLASIVSIYPLTRNIDNLNYDLPNNTNTSITSSLNNSLATNSIITVEEMANFLLTKEEHYPISDEFIEHYQQASGGYIDNAKKAGLVVDKYMHEPNQKWHFFESWYYASLEDGTLKKEDDAKAKIYKRLLCPELLLWIFEASGVSPLKVQAAKVVAETGKVNKTHISTVAKNMRQCVTREDIEVNITK